MELCAGRRIANELIGLATLLIVTVPSSIACSATPVLSGPATFVVSDCSSASLALRFIADTAPVAVRSKDITMKGSANLPVPWTISWDKPIPSDQSINEYQAVGTVKNGCPMVGAYDVPLAITSAGSANPAALMITVSRRLDPVLDAPASITLPLETWPFAFPLGANNLAVPLREGSRAAALEQISASGTELKSVSGESVGISLIPAADPLSIPPGGGAQLGLALSRTPYAGVYTTRLTLYAPALKQSQTIDVTVKVRVFWVFLLLFIALGVALGWFVNVRLAQRASLDAALLAGLRAAAAIAQRAIPQKDPAAQQRLIALAESLEVKVRGAATPEVVQEAVTSAQTQVSAVEAQAVETAKSFAQNLSRIRAIMSPSNVPVDDVIGNLLAPLADKLDRIDRMGAAGDVEEAARRLDAFTQLLPRDVISRLRPWLAELQSALDDFGTWAGPEHEPEKTRAELHNKIQTAYPLSDPAILIQQTDAIARQLRGWLVLSAPTSVAQIFRAAATVLRQGGKADLADGILVKGDSVMRLGAVPDLLALLKALAAARHETEALIRAALGSNEVEKLLATGDFVAAANLIVPAAPAAVRILTLIVPEAPPRAHTALPAAPTPDVPPRLILPPQMIVDQPTRALLDWGGTTPLNTAPGWSCAPPEAAQIGEADARGADITPRQAGLLSISATLGDTPPTVLRASAYVGEVTATQTYSKIASDAARVSNYVATATAILTIFAGYQIFIGAWVGSFSDFFGAFIWGFFGQFGMDRVRDLAKPITSKVLP